jgi:tetratricopeptide (TPR) repeat protein
LETLTLELAVNYRKWGVFEIYSPEAATNFEKAIQILTESGPFKSLSDSSRLALISSTRLAWGKHLFDTGKIEAAASQFYQGLESAQLLSEIVYEADTALLIIYYDNIVGPLYEKMGTALLHLGRTEEAMQAYERAVVFNVNHPINSLYSANVSVLDQDESSAFINYGSIAYTFEAAIAFFELNRLAREFPQKRAYIEGFIPKLRNGLASKNERLVGPEMDFWYAKYQSDYFLALSKLDSAVYWSRKAMGSAAKCKDQLKEEDDWKRRWLDEQVNLPFLLLQYDWKNPATLNECIQHAETAEAYLSQLDSVYFYYSNRALLKTNLAHALLLRNGPGDQEKALEQYRLFIDQFDDLRGYDNRDLLKKDIRDLKRLGVQWPDVPALEKLLNEDDNQ